MNVANKPSEGLLLTPRQAAAELAISERHLWNLKIPTVRLGRSVRYDRRDLEQYITDRKAVLHD